MQDENQPTANANPNSNNVQPQPLSGGGQKVIQPTPELLQHLQTQQQETAQPVVVSSDSAQAVQPTMPQSVYPQPSTPANGQIQVGIAASQMQPEKRHIQWSKFIKWGLPIVILAAAGIVLATNQNIRAVVLRQKLVTYNYPICKTHICTVKFYRGSKIAPYTPWTPPGEQPQPSHVNLNSPIIDGKTYVTMRIDADNIAIANTSLGKQLLDSSNNCSGGTETTGFSEYLPNLDVNANVCAITADHNPSMVLGYNTVFESQKANALFVVLINENFSINSQGQTSAVFNLADHQSEVQSILSSLDIKNK